MPEISVWQACRMVTLLGLSLSLAGCYPRYMVIAVAASKHLNASSQSKPLSMVVTIFELGPKVMPRTKNRTGWEPLRQNPVLHHRVKSFVLLPGEIKREQFKISRGVSRVVVRGAYYLKRLKKQKVLIQLKRGLPFRTLHYQIKADDRGINLLNKNRGRN